MRVVKIDHGTEQIPRPPVELEQLQLEHPLVLVIWRDAFFDFDQTDADDVRPDYLVHTVGFLLAEGPTFVSLGAGGPARRRRLPRRHAHPRCRSSSGSCRLEPTSTRLPHWPDPVYPAEVVGATGPAERTKEG